MGRIPEYNRGQLASEYVGGAQRDDSAAAIGEAVQNTLQPIVKNEIQKVEAKRKAQETLAANSAFIQFGLEAQPGLVELQKTYASNPREYPAAAQKYLNEKEAATLKNTGNENVSRELQDAIGTLKRSVVASSIAFVDTQLEANATVAFEDAAKATAIQAMRAKTVVEYKQLVDALNDSDSLASTLDAVSPAKRKAIVDKYTPEILKAHLENRVREDGEQLIQDIKNKVYDNAPGFDAKLGETYTSQAETRIKAQEIIKRAERRENEEARKYTISMRMGTHDILEEEIDAMVQANRVNPDDGIDEPTGQAAKEALFRQTTYSLGLRPDMKKYVKALDLVFTERADKAKVYDALLNCCDGDRTDAEKAFMARITRNKDEVKNAFNDNWFFAGGRILGQMAQRKLFSVEEEADVLMGYVHQVRLGMDPKQAMQKVIQDKQLKDHPNLAGKSNIDAVYSLATDTTTSVDADIAEGK